jgi:hypothetical protein
VAEQLFLKLVLISCIMLGVTGIGWWARTHPNRSKENPHQVRLPKAVPVVGWLFICVGLLMGLVAFASPGMPPGARIAAAAIFAGGLTFVAMYRNFYIDPRADEVAFRTALGTEHLVPYSDIARYSLFSSRGQQILTITSIHGAKLSINIGAFDVGPLLQAIEYHQMTGRWPARVGVADPGASGS